MVKTEKKVDKKPRTDKRNNVGSVAEVLAKNPNATIREISEKTWLWIGTIHRAIEELEKTGTKDTTISYIVWSAKDNLKDLAKLQRAKIKKMVSEYIVEDDKWNVSVIQDKEINMRDLEMMSKMWKDYMQQITVLWWDITDPNWWLKDQTISEKQQQAIDSLKAFMLWS